MDYRRLHETAIAELKQYKTLEASGEPLDRQKAAMIRAALLTTSEPEQYTLEQYFINGEGGRKAGHVDRIMTKYGISKTELYRLRDNALTNYCFSMLIAVMGGNQEARST